MYKDNHIHKKTNWYLLPAEGGGKIFDMYLFLIISLGSYFNVIYKEKEK